MSNWPYFSQDEIDAVTRVMQSGKVNYWTGEEGRAFEKEFADYVGVKHAIAVDNGTVALELALRALGVGVADEVIVPCRTFIATASCVVARGAKPVVADIDLQSQNITAETIRPLINANTKAIIVVHLAGWPCDMDAILSLAKQHNLYVIEDCAQAHGATYKGKPVGSLADIGTFSFCQDKIITTGGEGGMITTNNPQWYKTIWEYKDHGKSYAKVHASTHAPGFRWLHDSFGSNARMTEMQAAIGRAQLKKLEQWIAQRNANAAIITNALQAYTGIRLTIPPQEVRHAFYKYYFFIRPESLKTGWSRDRIMQEVNARGVGCFTGGCPEIYREQAFLNSPYGYTADFTLPNAAELGATSLMLLIHPTLKSEDLHNNMKVVCEILDQAIDLKY